MRATYRVRDEENQAIGFLIENHFYTDSTIKSRLPYVENIYLDEQGILAAEDILPELTYAEAVNQACYQEICTQNPFQRDIAEQLVAWKRENEHVVLQLEGARQIGKTTELLKFAYRFYKRVLYVDLATQKTAFLPVIENGCMPLDMEEYCVKYNFPHYLDTPDTILILDEIQTSREAYNAIRRFHDNLKCDIVVTGSYLGRILGNEDFFLPAGTVRYLHMFPLGFGEFCRVFGQEELLKEIDLYGASKEQDYKSLETLYQIYRKIGGYPEVVKKYVQTKNIEKCYETIEKLLYTFKDESRNYFKNSREVEIFEQVYREALKEMCRKKRGTGNNIIETITSLTQQSTPFLVNKKEIANAVVWLHYTGVLGMCNLAVDGDLRNIVPYRRIYFSDCGIAAYLAKQSLLDRSSLTGLLTETFVYNELHRLFYDSQEERRVLEEEVCFSVYGEYELDFMLADRNRTVYGINPFSLKVFITKNLIDRGIVVKPTQGGHGPDFDTIPIYTVGYRFPYEESK